MSKPAHTSKRDRVVPQEREIVYRAPGGSYQSDALILDASLLGGGAQAGRSAELALLLRMAVQAVARQLEAAVPVARRTKEESQFLFDCVRDRCAASQKTLARLLDIQSRAESPYYVSESVRAIEAQLTPTPLICIHEASEAEQEAQSRADIAQLLFAKERTPVRAAQLAETMTTHHHASRVVIDAAWRVARRTA